MATLHSEHRRVRSRTRTRGVAIAAMLAMACCLGGCHGEGYYAVHGHYPGGHYHGYGGHSGATGDRALLLLAFYGVAALLSWCLD